ncbi:MAG: polymerase subunit delta [Bacteroidota bacterium]|jgi:DNA polymerase-3 subunit delta
MDFEKLKKDIETRKFAPIYYLGGAEPYYVDKLSKLLEEKVLNPGEEAFNKAVLFGADTKAPKLLGELRSFPMMASRRLVMLKEAQSFGKSDWDGIQSYLDNPVPSTVFVMTFKGKDLDQRTKSYKSIEKNGIVFKSKALYDNQIPAWIEDYCTKRGYPLAPDAQRILAAYLGTNLALIESELEKIFLYMAGSGSKHISTEIVFEMINVDKDFNVFELMNSLGARDHARSHWIVSHLMRNVKENPPVLIVFQLFQFYAKLLRLQSRKLTIESEIARELKIHPFVARQYVVAVRSYGLLELYRNLAHILEADLYLKGIQSTHMGDEHVMKTLIYKLLN